MKTISLLTVILLLAMTSGNLEAKSAFKDKSEGRNLVPVNRTIAKANGLSTPMGVYVVNTIGVNTKTQLALHSGDIILAMNGKVVNRPASITPEKIAKEPGDVVTYKIWRNKKIHILNLRKPTVANFENSNQFDVLYDEVPFNTGSFRCVITKPKGVKKAPAILLIQSVTSGMVCNVPEDNMYRQLTDNFTQKGYVCMRVERMGVGENIDQLSSDKTDVFLESLAFEKALRQLKKYEFVDSTKTFLFGHCTGGKISSLLAARNPVQGVIVYGSCLNPTSEYLNKMLWTKLQGSEKSDEEVSKAMQECQLVIQGILVKKMTPTAFADTHPELIPVMRKMFDWKGDDNFMGRNVLFTHSLEKMESWIYLRHMNTNLLAIRGTADTQLTDGSLVKEMVDAANYYRPGSASLIEIPETDHNFAKVGTLKKSFELEKLADYSKFAPIIFNSDIVNTADNWMSQVHS